MSSKATPWVRVLAYPLEETTIITAPGFVRTDLLAHLTRDPRAEPPPPHRADLELGGVRLTTPQLALEAGVIHRADNLLWWDLTDPQEGTELGGYTVTPYLVPRSNRIADSLVEIVGKHDPLPLDWLPTNPEGGTPDYWETCRPDAEPQTEAVAWRGTDRDDRYGLTTTQKLPAGQSFAVRLWVTGVAPVFSDDEDQGPYLDFIWGAGKWAVSFSLLRPPALCTAVNGQWRRARTFEEFGTDLFATGEPLWLRVFQVAGRLVVEIEPVGGKIARVVYTEVRPDAYGVNQACPVRVGAGPAELRGRGVAFSAQLHEYRWGHWVEETTDQWGLVTPAHFEGTGSFEREYNCTRRVIQDEVYGAAFGYFGDGGPFRRAQFPEGDAGRVAAVSDEPVLDARGRTTGRRRYTCTLTAHNPTFTREDLETSSTNMAGATTPFVYAVSVRVTSGRTAASRDPIDLRPALRTLTEDLADPMVQAGVSWQLGIWRNLLPECIHQGTGGPVGDAWPQYVAKYHRLDVDLSWQKQDGAVGAGPPPYEGAEAPYCRRLIGFLTATAPEAPGPGRYPATLTARDMSVLLQPPAGLVDGRFAPLDLLLREKLDLGGGRTLMGWEGVHYILQTALGPDIADQLQHIFPEGHYDLLTHRMMLDPPHGGFFFPPPWGQSAYQWIMTLAERDFAVFFWAALPADSTKVAPYYANYYSYLENAPEMIVPDAVYLGGGDDDLLLRAGAQHDPLQDFNRVLVWGAPPGQGELGGVMPALQAFSAEARIESGSPVREQNIDDTWERTKLLRGSHFWLGRVARLVALNTARLIRGIDQRSITLTIRGNPYLWWGWKVRPRMNAVQSDPFGLSLHNVLCRIMRVRNAVDLERGQYETTLRVAPEPEV